MLKLLWRRGRMVLTGLILWVALPSSGTAQDTTAAIPAPSEKPAPQSEVDAKRSQLHDIENGLSESDARRRKMEADIEAIRADRVRLNAALIDTAGKVHDAEGKAAGIEQRLDTLKGSEEAITRSLNARRGTITEVLAVLQRIGRKPLPAVLVRPEDMLLAIRTSMLLGAVIPELRGEVDALASDLADLTKVKAAITADRDALSQEMAGLSEERDHLDALVAARQQAQVLAEGALQTEQQHAADLARLSVDLKDLVGRMEAEAARLAGDPRRKAAEADAAGVRARVAAGGFQDPARLAPATAFVDAKGLLPFPATGGILKRFGADDGFGSPEKGISIATRPGAVVSSPSDGWISFSGPYRTYGQLLIINAGSGYYIVLAGMDHTNVTVGQFVLAGEPIGAMGDGSVKTAAAIALGAAKPILYVEFRKDGAAIDPSPWWAKADIEKVRG